MQRLVQANMCLERSTISVNMRLSVITYMRSCFFRLQKWDSPWVSRGASHFCKKHFFYYSASLRARVLYSRAGTLALYMNAKLRCSRFKLKLYNLKLKTLNSKLFSRCRVRRYLKSPKNSDNRWATHLTYSKIVCTTYSGSQKDSRTLLGFSPLCLGGYVSCQSYLIFLRKAIYMKYAVYAAVLRPLQKPDAPWVSSLNFPI